MFSVQNWLALFSCVLVFCKVSEGARKGSSCDPKDCKDLTNAVQKTYHTFVKGSKNWDSSEVLQVDYLQTHLPMIADTLKNITMSKMENCKPTRVWYYEKTSTFDYFLTCPHIIYRAEHYETYGHLSKQSDFIVEGEGTNRVDYYDFVFQLNGPLVLSRRDGANYIQIKTFTLNTEINGKVVYNYPGLEGGDKKKEEYAEHYLKKHYKQVEKDTNQPIMSAFMTKFVKNQNDYLNVTSFDSFMN